MRLPFFALLSLITFVTGCATSAVPSFNVPGQSSADTVLRADVSKMINFIEKSQAPRCSYKIIDTKVVGVDDTTVKEEWIVESCGQIIVYPVMLIPDPRGGSYYKVITPDFKLRSQKK
jgi:hypothetical protein